MLGASHQFARFRASVAAGHIDYDYDAPQDFRDSSEDNFTGRLDAEVTPRMAAFVQARVDDREYDNQPGLSSEGRTFLAGLSLDVTDLIRGEIGVGQFERVVPAHLAVASSTTARTFVRIEKRFVGSYGNTSCTWPARMRSLWPCQNSASSRS